MNYFLYGSEQFLLKQELEKILKKGQHDNIGTVYYDGQASDFSVDQVLEDANTISMFSDRKVIIINNPAFLYNSLLITDEQITAMTVYLRNSSEFTTLIFYLELDEQGVFDQRKKAFKLLLKECRVITVPVLSNEEFRRLVSNDLKTAGIAIEPAAVNELISRLPVNIANWKIELMKLSLYGGKIDEQDVKHLISRSMDDNVFIMVNAVIQKNLKRAIDTWHDLAVMKHDPIELVAILAAQFRFMYQCSVLTKQYSPARIAELLNAKPARVSITLNNSRGISGRRMLSLLDQLASLDQKIKNGIIDKQLGFELFLIEATR
ncbi:MAG: DNA polymerase III subunit delta [Erysipelotrichaceae bacterium]|nr:DNA polymerase III subunit delta [Erysipelotrichaceae bacterium]